MGVCENILSKQYILKAKHQAVREWHLQTVLSNLAQLSNDQRQLVCEQMNLGLNHLNITLKNIIRKSFYKLLANSIRTQGLEPVFEYYIVLKKLAGAIGSRFLKKAITIQPTISSKALKGDPVLLYKKSVFWNNLKQTRREERQLSR